jgi:hypothetical protein
MLCACVCVLRHASVCLQSRVHVGVSGGVRTLLDLREVNGFSSEVGLAVRPQVHGAAFNQLVCSVGA